MVVGAVGGTEADLLMAAAAPAQDPGQVAGQVVTPVMAVQALPLLQPVAMQVPVLLVQVTVPNDSTTASV
jgi:hypothetical protein